MNFWKKFVILLASIVLPTIAHAQSVGQLGTGQVWANPTLAVAPAQPINLWLNGQISAVQPNNNSFLSPWTLQDQNGATISSISSTTGGIQEFFTACFKPDSVATPGWNCHWNGGEEPPASGGGQRIVVANTPITIGPASGKVLKFDTTSVFPPGGAGLGSSAMLTIDSQIMSKLEFFGDQILNNFGTGPAISIKPTNTVQTVSLAVLDSQIDHGTTGQYLLDSTNSGIVVSNISIIELNPDRFALCTVTITIASPAVITCPGGSPAIGTHVFFTTTGALPTGITASVTYYVSSAGHTGTTYRIADTEAHAIAGTNSINTSGTQSGVQTSNALQQSSYGFRTTCGNNMSFDKVTIAHLHDVGPGTDAFDWCTAPVPGGVSASGNFFDLRISTNNNNANGIHTWAPGNFYLTSIDGVGIAAGSTGKTIWFEAGACDNIVINPFNSAPATITDSSGCNGNDNQGNIILRQGRITIGGQLVPTIAGAILAGHLWVSDSTTITAKDGGPMWDAGYESLYPNPANSPGSGPANQVAQDGFGTNVNISSTTTGGLHELELVAAATGWPTRVSQFGNTPTGQPQFIGTSTTFAATTRGYWIWDLDNVTINCTMTNSTPCITMDSAENGRWIQYGQLVFNTGSDDFVIKPVGLTPSDHFCTWSLNDFRITNMVTGSASTEALLKIDLTTTPCLGVQQNTFKVFEMNGANNPYGMLVTTPAAASSGETPKFNHNKIELFDIHGNATAGIQVGTSTTRQSQLNGNIWTAMFIDNTATDGIVTYESHSFFTVGFFNDGSALTNGLHFKSGSTNNVAILLDVAGATNPVVDDNTPGGGNIIIGNGNITVGGFNIALQNSNVVFASVNYGGATSCSAYNSGTWTPTLTGSTSGSWTLSTHVGSYVQNCADITAWFNIVASGSSAPVGNIIIGGLPVGSTATANDFGGCQITDQVGMTNTTNFTSFTGLISTGGATTISLLEVGSGQTTQVAPVARASTTPTLIGICHYHT